MAENKGLKALEGQVLEEDLCVGCGACASLCPYLRSWQGRIVKLHDCDLTQGRCFDYCPRTEVDINRLYQSVFEEEYRGLDIGPMRRVVAARAADPELRSRAQAGGVVSALMDLILREGFAHAAVLTERRANLLPEGRIVRDHREILTLAGSGYVAGPTLEAFNRGSFEKEERIALVGLPCQVTALTKMRVSSMDRRPPVDQVVMVIGLFCTWALSYAPFFHYLNKRLGDAQIRKMDVTPPPERLVNVTTDSETFHIPVEEIRPFIRSGCGVCVDMTAELADLSVGMVEGRPGWNTIIARTQAGEDLFAQAEGKGILETGPLHEGYLSHLREASRLKKLRAFTALEERGDARGGYLRIEDQIRRQIMSYTEKASK